MIVFLLLLILLCAFGFKYKKDQKENNYLDKRTTSCVLGLFAIIIFFGHFCRHFDYSPWYDKIAVTFVDTFLSQLIVVPFLFYSGYGIMTQYKQKGDIYLKNFPLQRILKIYLIYLICLLVEFLFNGICTGSFNFNPLSLTMWNTRWFIFVITAEYILVWLSFIIFRKHKQVVGLSILLLSIILGIILCLAGKSSAWYSTIIAFPFGVIYSLYLDKINDFLSKKKRNPFIVLTVSVCLFAISWILVYKFNLARDGFTSFAYYLEVVPFMVIILMITYLFNFGNKALLVISNYTVWSYLLQDISFLLFETKLNVSGLNKCFYLIVCIIFTSVLCFILKYAFDFAYKKTIGKLKFKENN